MRKDKYDIFVSYRRTSYDTANLIATRLRFLGYSVFFDTESLRSGKFNDQLYDVIRSCKDFILVLPPNALDRCVNTDDWVRLEVCKAMEMNKNVIPIMLNGFSWPEPMPQGMEDLRNYQALTTTSVEYFDMAIKMLQQRYLKSKSRQPIRRAIKVVGISLATLIALLLVMWGVFVVISKGTCQKYATIITRDAAQVYVLAEANHSLEQEWTVFNNAINFERRPERISFLKKDMLGKIDLAVKNITVAWSTDSLPLNIGSYEGFLLSLHKINTEELSLSPKFATTYYRDFMEMLDIVRASVEDPTSMSRRYATALFKFNECSFNAYYASVLSELSKFPESATTSFGELSPHWVYFPMQYRLGGTEAYYNNIINAENKRAEDILSKYEGFLEQVDARLDDLEQQHN